MKRIFGITVAAFALGLFSCNNDKVETITADEALMEKSAAITVAEVQVEAVTTQSTYEVEFFANAEETLTRWWKIGKKLQLSNKLRYKNQCPDMQISGEDYPKTITLNYGDSTVLRNGKVLSGVIEIYISAERKSKDYERTVTYTDFTMDSLVVNGTSSAVVDKVDEMFREVSSDLSFVLADGTTITRTSVRTWQWVAGMDTEEDQSDDIVTISGNAEAKMNDSVYKKDITTPLKRIGDCKYIVEGVVVIALDGTVVSTLDYGDGTCDEFAILTDADGETTIDLSERKVKRNKGKQNGNKDGNGNS
jgi:hypothetical protein